jgi:hypothetical protein
VTTSDPFARISRRPREPEPDYDPEAGPGYIRVPCKRCETMCVRQQFSPFKWEHEDDEVVIKGLSITSFGKYDHNADPDFIDVEVIE